MWQSPATSFVAYRPLGALTACWEQGDRRCRGSARDRSGISSGASWRYVGCPHAILLFGRNPLIDHCPVSWIVRCICSRQLLALSVSLLRSDLVAFRCEADMRTVDRSNQSDVNDPEPT